MSINASYLRAFLEMNRRCSFRGDAVIWGVQDVMMSHAQAEQLLQTEGVDVQSIPAEQRSFGLSKNQQQFTQDPCHYMSLTDLWRMMGFPNVKTLDAFPHDKPDILCNLSEPLPNEHKGKFKLLIDIGVLEHCSNGFMALQNAADLLDVGGWAVFYTPLLSPIQTCMFHPNPPMYYDILSANGFGNFKSYINWMPDWDQRSDIPTVWLEYVYNDDVLVPRTHYYTILLVVAQKLEHVEAFKPVLQNYYVQWHSENGIPRGNQYKGGTDLVLAPMGADGKPMDVMPPPAQEIQPSLAAAPLPSRLAQLYRAVLPERLRTRIYLNRHALVNRVKASLRFAYQAAFPERLRAALYVLRRPALQTVPRLTATPVGAAHPLAIGATLLDLGDGKMARYAHQSTVPERRDDIQPIPRRMFVENPPREQLYL